MVIGAESARPPTTSLGNDRGGWLYAGDSGEQEKAE